MERPFWEPNSSFGRFIKNMLRDSPQGDPYRASVILLKLPKQQRGTCQSWWGKYLKREVHLCVYPFKEAVHRAIFKLCTCCHIFSILLGDPLPLSHSILLCLYYLESFHPLRMLCPSLSQCCQVNFCFAFRLKIVCLESSIPCLVSYTMPMSVLLF